MAPPVLFFFTKTYPYGTGEQYIEEELPLLSAAFSKVIIIPCSIFGNTATTTKLLPENCEVFLVNNSLKKKTVKDRIRNLLELVPVVMEAVLNNKDGFFFYRNIRRSLVIFRQQQSCADSINNLIAERRIDASSSVFYSYWVHSSCIILGIMKRRGFIPGFVSRAHSYDLYHQDFFKEDVKPPLPWEYFKFKSADKIYCISTHGAKFLREKYPAFSGKFLVSRLGVENAPVANPPEKSGDYFRIASCSTIQYAKRIYMIPEIMAHLDFPVEWVHFGEGDKASKEILDDSIKKYSRPQHVYSLKGYVANDEIRKFYENTHIDLFLNLSLAEGVPVSLMEAASYGIPLLATDVYGSGEIARPECGFLVPKKLSPEEVANIIKRMKNDEALCNRLRAGGIRIQQQYFNSRNNFNAFIHELKNG